MLNRDILIPARSAAYCSLLLLLLLLNVSYSAVAEQRFSWQSDSNLYPPLPEGRNSEAFAAPAKRPNYPQASSSASGNPWLAQPETSAVDQQVDSGNPWRLPQSTPAQQLPPLAPAPVSPPSYPQQGDSSNAWSGDNNYPHFPGSQPASNWSQPLPSGSPWSVPVR